MTPLIREMVAFTGSIDDSPLKPEEMMWFDAGRLSPTEAIRVPADLMMNLPFPRTAIATIDTKGVKVVLWLISGDGSVTVGGSTLHNHYAGIFGESLSPFTYFATPEGIRYYKGDSQIEEVDVKQMFRMVCACLLKLHDCTEAHQPTAKANSLTNKRRIAKGKPPLIYDWHTVKLEPNGPASEPQGGTHATPRRHQCRGHWRTCKSGKRVWVKDCWKGDASKGTVFKDYKAATNEPVAA